MCSYKPYLNTTVSTGTPHEYDKDKPIPMITKKITKFSHFLSQYPSLAVPILFPSLLTQEQLPNVCLNINNKKRIENVKFRKRQISL